MTAEAFELLGANACLLAAGLGVLRAVRGPGALAEGLPALGLAYLAGVAAFGVVAPLLLMAGLALDRAQFVALCGGLLLAGFLRQGARRHSIERLPGRAPALALLAWGLTALFLVLLAVDFAFQPLFRSDAWGQWTLKAKAIVLFGGLDGRLWGPSEIYQGANVDYPLLLPALEAGVFRFMGFDTRILHLQFWLLLAAFVPAVLALLRNRVPAVVTLPVLAAAVVSPRLSYELASAYADVPLAIFFALAGLCAWRWLRSGRRSDLGLFALFSAAVLATKIEGLVFVVALLAGVLGVARGRSRAAAAAAGAGALLVAFVPWRVWVDAHDVVGHTSGSNAFSPGFLAAHTERIPRALGALVRETLDPSSWLLVVPLAVVAAVLAVRRGRRDAAALALVTAALSLAGLVWIYWATPLDLAYHLATSDRRVVVGPVLFLAVLTPVLLAEADFRGRLPP